MTRIKICGLTREADVDAAVEAGADAIGFVLYEKSPRHVLAQRAGQLAARLPAFVTPVVLLVNATDALLAQALEAVPNALLQFHGDESVSDCQRWGRPYLRAARMGAGFDLLDFAHQFPAAQAMLVDAHVEGYGGGGKVFDWSLLPSGLRCPMILSGGLHPGNVACAVAALLAAGAPRDVIAQRLAALQAPTHRLAVAHSPEGQVVIDDTFNSNPAGARAALAALGEVTPGRRVVVTPGIFVDRIYARPGGLR